MSNLPMEVNHSISWLNNNSIVINNISSLSFQFLNNLCMTPITKDGYTGYIKATSKKFSDKLKKKEDLYMIDYELFKTEMDDIIKNKNDSSISYYSSRYLVLLNTYTRTYKNISKMYDLYLIKKEKAERENNYALFIAINKLSQYIYRINVVCKRIINKLKMLLNNTNL